MSDPKRITLKQAKPNQDDLDTLKRLVVAIHEAEDGSIPTLDDDETPDSIDDVESKARAFDRIMQIATSGRAVSLDRCVWSLVMLMDPANHVVNPDADHIELHPFIVRAMDIVNRLDEINRMAKHGTALARAVQIIKTSIDAADLWREMQQAGTTADEKGGEQC